MSIERFAKNSRTPLVLVFDGFLKNSLDSTAVIVEDVILGHIVAGQAVALYKHRACRGNGNIPANVASALLYQCGFKAQVHRLLKEGNLKAYEGEAVVRMLFVVRNGLIASRVYIPPLVTLSTSFLPEPILSNA